MRIRLLPGSEERDAKLALQCTREILGDNTLCSLATVDRTSDSPYIWTAYYCFTDDLQLYVLTPPQTRHGQQSAANAATAVAVYSSGQPWGTPKRGLQLLGTSALAKAGQTAKALTLYLRRYPALAHVARHPSELGKIDARFYVITVNQVRLFDEPAFGNEVFVDLEVVR